MPPPTPNRGQLISQTNTGYNAVVDGYTPPASLTTHSGNFTTSSNGQVVDALNITGYVDVRHANVTFTRCKLIQVRAQGPKPVGTKIHFCTIGIASGLVEDNWGTTQIGIGGVDIWRCQLYGAIDHTRTNWGRNRVWENWFGPPYADPTGHTGGERAHCDPFQPHNPPSGAPPFESLLIQGNRFDIFLFEKGEQYTTRLAGGSKAFDVSNGPATCGSVNAEYGSTKNITFRDNYCDGNYSQFMYILNNPNQGGAIDNTVVIDNIIKKRGGRINYGKSHFLNGHNNRITWGRNLDADTGAAIPGGYDLATSPIRYNATILAPGPSSQYPSMFGDAPPPGVVKLAITTPAGGSSHTSGSVTFVGGADTAAGDSDANYTYFNYYIESVDPDGLDKTHLDRDAATANSGVVLTASSSGVAFTDRAGAARTAPRGDYYLRIEGERLDGTRPFAQITVSFGTVAPPPTAGSFSIDITATTVTNLHVDYAAGGVPDALVETRPRFKQTPDPEFYAAHAETGEELIRSGGRWILKGSEL